jgi:hypothetical protein
MWNSDPGIPANGRITIARYIRMKRRLFSILTAVSLLLFVAMGVLWVRSYWVRERVCSTFFEPSSPNVWDVVLSSNCGSLALGFVTGVEGSFGLFNYTSERAEATVPETVAQRCGFGYWHLRRLWMIQIPLWLPVLATAILPALWLRNWRQRDRLAHLRRLCLKCGYDLRASKERCPECGTAIQDGRVKMEEKRKEG